MIETSWQFFSSASPDQDYVALLAYLPLASARHLARLIMYSVRIQRQLSTSPGLIGYSLAARLAAKEFWTLSAWENETALQAFVAAPPHLTAMAAMAPYMGQTRFVRWSVKGAELPPRWNEALKR